MLTPAECRLQGHEVDIYCTPCRMGRRLDLEPFIVSKHDKTPFAQLWKERRFKCVKCKGKACTVIIYRVKVGTTERLETWGPG